MGVSGPPPSKGPDEKLTARTFFRSTPKEKSQIESDAKKAGMTLSQYIRWRLLYRGEK